MLFSRLFTDKDKYFDSQGFNIRGVCARAFLRHLLCNLHYPTACLGSCIIMTTFVSPQMGEPLSHPYLIYEAFPERYLDTMQDAIIANCSDYFAELAKGW